MEGQPPLESGASQNDMDYLHVINWQQGRRGRRPAGQDADDPGIYGHPAGDGRPRRAALLRAGAQEPAWRGRHPRRQVSGVSRQARHPRDRLRLGQDQEAIDAGKFEGTRPLRRTDPGFKDSHPRPGRDGPGAAPHPVRRPGQRLHVAVHRVEDRQVVPQGPEGPGQDPGPLQRRPPGHARGRHRAPEGPVPGLAGQMVDRPLQQRRAAPAAELPAHRHRATPRCSCSTTCPSALGEPHYAQIISADKLQRRADVPARGREPGHRTSRIPTRPRRRARRASSATAAWWTST